MDHSCAAVKTETVHSQSTAILRPEATPEPFSIGLSEALLNLSTDALIAIGRYSGHLTVLTVNRASVQMLGVQTGRPLFGIPTLAPLADSILRVLDRGENEEADLRLHGARYSFSIQSVDLSGQTVALVRGQLADARSDPHRAAYVLDGYDLALRPGRDGVWTWDLSDDSVWFSPEWKSQFGFEDHELENSRVSWSRLIFPEDEAKSARMARDFVKGRRPTFEVIQRYRHRDGHTVMIFSRAFRVMDGNGRVIRLVGAHTDLTDLSELEAARQKAEMRLLNAIERLNDGFVLYDSDDRIVMLNTRLRDFYPELGANLQIGTSFEEMLRLSVSTGSVVLPPDVDLEKWLKERTLAHRNPGPPIERRLKSGKVIRISEFRTADGGIVSLGVDITELRQNERRFRALIDGSLQGIVIHRGHQALFANQSFAQVVGMSAPADVVATGTIALLRDLDLEPELAPLQAALQSSQPGLRGDVRPVTLTALTTQRQCGDAIVVDVAVSVVDWFDGPALQTTVVDVTERAVAENALRGNEARLRALLDNSVQGIAIHRGYQPLYVNLAYARLHGFESADEILAANDLTEIMLPERRSLVTDSINRLMQGGPPIVRSVTEALRKDGSRFWTEISASRVEWSDGPAIQSIVVDVGDRVAAIAAVERSEKRFRDLVAGSLQGIAIHRGYQPLYVNEAYAQIYGFSSSDDVLASGSLEWTINPEDRESVRQNMVEMLESGRSIVRQRAKARRRDGMPMWTEISVKRVEWHDGPALQSIIVDVTEQIVAVAALQDSERRFRDLVGTVPGMVYQWYEKSDGKVGYRYVSPRSTVMYGIEPEELLLDWRRLRMHPDDAERRRQVLPEVMKNGGDWTFEGRFLLPGGVLRWFRAVSRPVRNNPDEVVFNGIIIDIDSERRAEDERRYREAMLSYTAGLAGLGYWVWDSALERTVYCSPELATIRGVTVDYYLENLNSYEQQLSFVYQDDLEYYTAHAIKVARSRRSYVVEYRIQRPDGQVRYVREVGGPVVDNDNHLTKYVGALQDVTDRKQRELELEEARDRLQRQASAMTALAHDLESARDAAEMANRAKSRFLAVMSHELRTPMTGVIGMVDLMMGTKLSLEQRRYLETLHSSADSLMVLLNDVLDLSKIEAGQMILEEIPLNPAAVIDDVRRLFAPAAAQKGIQMNSALPAIPLPAMLGDPTRLRQVLVNFVGNAVKFTQQGRVDIVLDAPERCETGWRLHLSVRDTGIGIAADVIPVLFEPFTQADASTTRRFGGTGLGLAICKRLVTQMGGRIVVESIPGQGSSFRFDMVLKPGVAVLQNPASRSTPAPIAESQSGRILVAEDNQVNRLLITTMLKRMGHVADAVENGLLALEAVQTRHYDLVLMDMQMPVMDGDAATEAIRRLPGPESRLPIVALTADALPEDRDRRMANNMFDEYLTKPINWPRLGEVIVALISRNRPAAPPDAAPNSVSTERSPES
jgi:PAS domain S-box-containing protein